MPRIPVGQGISSALLAGNTQANSAWRGLRHAAEKNGMHFRTCIIKPMDKSKRAYHHEIKRRKTKFHAAALLWGKPGRGKPSAKQLGKIRRVLDDTALAAELKGPN